MYFVVGDGGNEEGPSSYSGQSDQVAALDIAAQQSSCALDWRAGICSLHCIELIKPHQAASLSWCGHHALYSLQPCALERPCYGLVMAVLPQVWSAFREPSFGHGILTLNSADSAQWRWNRNLDSSANADVVGDQARPQFSVMSCEEELQLRQRDSANVTMIPPIFDDSAQVCKTCPDMLSLPPGTDSGQLSDWLLTSAGVPDAHNGLMRSAGDDHPGHVTQHGVCQPRQPDLSWNSEADR